jgi:glycosyltransferase involved in cell wall biosynthesis
MRVLLSVFSCAPGFGSEAGVGWNWAVEVARLGHEVVALTETKHRAAIERALASGELPPTLSFEFFMPAWLDRLRNRGIRLGYESLTLHLTHLVWQWLAYRHVRRRLADRAFDLVHHVTYGGIRHPTFMGRLPWPLALGPLGGGERAPHRLRGGLPWRGRLKDLVRDAHTWLIRLDPITRRACADALVVYVKTRESAAALPKRYRHKAVVEMEIGIPVQPPPRRPERPSGQLLRLLYAGRFLGWKGMHLGLRALADFRARGGAARLTMVGRGPDERAWRALAHDLGLDDSLDWLGWTPHDRMGELYCSHDALLFPSLHDSSGNAVLEALAQGLPVICLDLGGPGVMVDASCGRVIATSGRSEADCVRGLADAMAELAGSVALRRTLSDGAYARARDFFWPKPVVRVYDDLSRRLAPQPLRPARKQVVAVDDG